MPVLQPFCVAATTGTTSTTSVDPVPEIAAICEREDPAYTVLHQNATFTAKRRDLGWKASGRSSLG